MQREERWRWLSTLLPPQPDTSLCNGFGKLEKVSPGSGGLRCSRDLAPLLPSRRYPTPQPLA